MARGKGGNGVQDGSQGTIAAEAFVSPAERSSPRNPLVPASLTASPRTTVLPKRRPAEATATVEIPVQPRFERLGALGEGGIGEVALALDHDISRRVAMKRLKSERRDAHSLVRFAEEVRIVGQLEHPGIVPVHDVGIDEDGQHYLVMKYIEGDTLARVIEKLRQGDSAYTARFTYTYRVQVFASILEAVGYAHDKGIIHRDLKPANVMIGPYGEVTIMDWGIAKYVGQTEDGDGEATSLASTVQERLLQTQQGALLGTPMYMSPEQAAGRNNDLDQRSDIFSLGLLFCEFLLLMHPLEHKQSVNEILAELVAKGIDVDAMRNRAAEVATPMELMFVVARALEHDRSKRYSSVKEMLAHLRRIQDGQIAIQCHVTLFKRAAYEAVHWVDRHPGTYSLLLLGFMLAIAGSVGFEVYRFLAR